jgi:hypothetical protein
MKRFSQPTVNVTRRRGVGVGGSNSAVVRVSYHRQSQLWLYVLETKTRNAVLKRNQEPTIRTRKVNNRKS